MTHDSHFMLLVEVFTNHNLTENTYFMNHIVGTEFKIMVLKTCKQIPNYSILSQF